MKQITFLLVAVAALAGVVAIAVPASLHADESAAPIFVTKIPPGYRDWRLISVAHEEGNLNSIGAVLGNDVAIKAYREGKLPFPDGTIIAALHYGHVPSDGKQQSLWPSPIFRRRPPHEHSVYGQGLDKVRRDGRLGVRYLHRRQTQRRGVNENLLPLPQSGQGSRPRLHALRTVISRITGDRSCCHEESCLFDWRRGSHLRGRRDCIRSGRRRTNA